MHKLESDPSALTSMISLTPLIEPEPQKRPHHETPKKEQAQLSSEEASSAEIEPGR